MKTIKVLLLVFAVVALSNCSNTEDAIPPQAVLIADYPLVNSLADVTGLHDPMTVINAPFENGGIYSNGVYEHSGYPDYCIVETPHLNGLGFNSFSVSMDFNVSQKRSQPVWVMGQGCRVLGFYLSEWGTIELLYNNSNRLSTEQSYSLDAWHNAKISFDGTTVKIFYDNKLIGSLKFGDGYVPLDIGSCATLDAAIMVTNYGNGESLQGHVRNLKIYSPQ